MIVASWNVNSINVRLPLVCQWLAEAKPDVLCLQETKIVDEKFPVDAFKDAGYECAFFGQKTYNGVAIISRHPVSSVVKNFPGSPLPDHARFIAGEVGSLLIMNAYVPNGGMVDSDKYETKLEWLRGLRKYLDESGDPQDRALLCGDFNVAPEDRDVFDPEGTRGGILVSDAERAALAELKDWGFEDGYRMHEEEAGHYTWWDYRAFAFRRKMGFRIDHVWLSKGLAPDCKRAWIDVEPRKKKRPSDHTPILVELA